MPSVDFASWHLTNLVRFAQDAQVKMDAQDKQIAQLQDDLRVRFVIESDRVELDVVPRNTRESTRDGILGIVVLVAEERRKRAADLRKWPQQRGGPCRTIPTR